MSGRGLIDVVYSSRCRSSGFILGDFANQLKREKKNFFKCHYLRCKERKSNNRVVSTDAVDSVLTTSLPPIKIK